MACAHALTYLTDSCMHGRGRKMEKTVIVLAANQLSTTPCGDTVNIDVNVAKSNKPCTETFSLCKTFWCCCSESVTDYCRVILDLFPTQHLVSSRCTL